MNRKERRAAGNRGAMPAPRASPLSAMLLGLASPGPAPAQQSISIDHAHAKTAAPRSTGRPPDVPQFIDSAAADARNRGGMARHAEGRLDEAIAAYRAAIQANPEFAEAYSNLGVALKAKGELEQAEASYARAIALYPEFAAAHVNLGVVLHAQGQAAKAIASFERALALDPGHPAAHSNLIFARNFDPALDTAAQQAEHSRWYARHGAHLAVAIAPHGNAPEPERRLRVGYVSADFRDHSAALIFAPVLRRHDKAQFDVVCYSNSHREDATTDALRLAATLWRETASISDQDLAALIRADRIDILIDLSGHTAGNRLLVFARKPAPVQVSAWGHAAGTGLATIDALFSDAIMAPAEERHLFAERIVDLPCAIGYEAPEDAPAVSALPATANGHLTFGSLNHPSKISPAVLRCWAEILHAVPHSRLLLEDRAFDEAGQQDRMRAALAAHGVAGDRLILRGSSSRADHMAICGQIDVALDPFPYGGGITTCETLWMGVPAVTLHGRTATARIGASIMIALGLADWAARSEEEYVALALAKARDLAVLAELRQGLRARMGASAFADPERYARAVEAAYRMLWREWCARATAART
jgi:predicted O-linked N-acetylglucosamine transferase (SPINDLY family)